MFKKKIKFDRIYSAKVKKNPTYILYPYHNVLITRQKVGNKGKPNVLLPHV